MSLADKKNRTTRNNTGLSHHFTYLNSKRITTTVMGEKGLFIDSIFLQDFYATHTGANTNTCPSK